MMNGIDPRARERILQLERDMKSCKREIGEANRRIASLEHTLKRILGPEASSPQEAIEREKRAQLELEHADDGAPRTIGAAGDVGWTDREGSSS